MSAKTKKQFISLGSKTKSLKIRFNNVLFANCRIPLRTNCSHFFLSILFIFFKAKGNAVCTTWFRNVFRSQVLMQSTMNKHFFIGVFWLSSAKAMYRTDGRRNALCQSVKRFFDSTITIFCFRNTFLRYHLAALQLVQRLWYTLMFWLCSHTKISYKLTNDRHFLFCLRYFICSSDPFKSLAGDKW